MEAEDGEEEDYSDEQALLGDLKVAVGGFEGVQRDRQAVIASGGMECGDLWCSFEGLLRR